MKTRCPAWCDRVIMNRVGRNLIDTSLELQHDLIGPAVCMGDHKVRRVQFSFPTTRLGNLIGFTLTVTELKFRPVSCRSWVVSASTVADL